MLEPPTVFSIRYAWRQPKFLENLQVLVIGHVDRDKVDGILGDPMPGGSGLQQHLQANYHRIIKVAREIVVGCPFACESSCIDDCLQTFRNGFYHEYLDRHVAFEAISAWGDKLTERYVIPAHQPTHPVNDGETKLKQLLAAAGFTSGNFQSPIRFEQPIVLDYLTGNKTPGVHFVGDEDDTNDKGICIDSDGMSDALHGDPATSRGDRETRSWHVTWKVRTWLGESRKIQRGLITTEKLRPLVTAA